MKLGLHNAARYYYYPGWHEPGTTSEFGFNKKAYDALPADLKTIIDYGCQSIQVSALKEYEYKNTIALHKLKTDFKKPGRNRGALSGHAQGETKKAVRPGDQGGVGKTPLAKKAYASVNKFET